MAGLDDAVKDISKDLAKPTDSTVMHMRSLRLAIGWIGVALPFALVIGENLRDWFITRTSTVGNSFIGPSISAYFHTGMRELFVGSICAIAVFLVCYKGYDRRDDLAANLAGICAFVVAIFPTTESAVTDIDSVTVFSDARTPDPSFVGWLHFIAAAVFFITLAIMSLYLFTLSTKTSVTPEKVNRNRVYRVCGWTMLACIALIAVGKLIGVSDRTSYMFWLESIAVVAFGFSWLTKAQVVFGDSAKP
jgi:hypothetical protein